MKKDINEGRGLEDKMRQLRLVLVQPKLLYDPKKSDADNDWVNINHAADLMNGLKADKHDLIVLPELYPCVAEVGVEQARPLLDKAKELHTYILAGEAHEGKNASTLIDPSGTIVGRAYKVNLAKEEIGHVQPGKRPGLFDVRGIKIGVLTYWDFAFPSQVEDLIERGAEVIINPSMLHAGLVNDRKSDARLYMARYGKPIACANLANTFNPPWGIVYGGGKSEVLIGTNTQISTLSRPTKESDYISKKLGSKEGLLKYALKLK